MKGVFSNCSHCSEPIKLTIFGFFSSKGAESKGRIECPSCRSSNALGPSTTLRIKLVFPLLFFAQLLILDDLGASALILSLITSLIGGALAGMTHPTLIKYEDAQYNAFGLVTGITIVFPMFCLALYLLYIFIIKISRMP
jgi:hypothetical protein